MKAERTLLRRPCATTTATKRKRRSLEEGELRIWGGESLAWRKSEASSFVELPICRDAITTDISELPFSRNRAHHQHAAVHGGREGRPRNLRATISQRNK